MGNEFYEKLGNLNLLITKLSHLSIVLCRVVHNVLKSNLDQVSEEKAVTKTPENTEVRGAAAFNQIITLNLSTNEHTRDSVPT